MIRTRKQRGFTLVELMIVVAIVGVLAALAIYGVKKYFASAKTTEARNALGRLAKDASSAWSREKMAGLVLKPGDTAAKSNSLCASAAAPVPATVPAGEKYQSSAADWNAGDQATGWQCLKFSIEDPQNFQYNYTATDPAGTAGKFDAVAAGDLNGDGTASSFTLSGAVQDGVVNVAPNIIEVNPEE